MAAVKEIKDCSLVPTKENSYMDINPEFKKSSTQVGQANPFGHLSAFP